MMRTFSKGGNSQEVAFDSTHMDLTRFKLEREHQIAIHKGASVTLIPVRARSSRPAVSRIIQSAINGASTATRHTV
jgi:hypothetical protein